MAPSLRLGSVGSFRPAEIVEFIKILGGKERDSVMVSTAGGGYRVIVSRDLPLRITGGRESIRSKRPSAHFGCNEYDIRFGDRVVVKVMRGLRFQLPDSTVRPKALYLWHK